MRERLFQFLKLRRWTVYFDPGEIGQFQHFREQRADVLQDERERRWRFRSLRGRKLHRR